jgi:non-haem Fe2+, alpha-ketoglutarate-dependent halogenase
VIVMQAAAQRGLSTSAIDAYHRDGIVFPVVALPPARVRQLREALEAVEARFGPGPVPMRWTNLCFSWAYDITIESAVLDSVEALLGPEIIVMGSIVLSKHPGQDAYVGWHQDSMTGTEEPAPAVSAWIAVTDSTPANGCMRVIPGTHRRILAHHDVRDPDNLIRGRRLAEPVDEARAVDVMLRAGEMSLHDDGIVHGSRANRGDDKRIGFVVRYATPAMDDRGFPVVRARGTARCPHLSLAGRPRECGRAEAFSSYLAFRAAQELERQRRGGQHVDSD